MKILLINPNISAYANYSQRFTMVERFFPLGIFSIANKLQDNKYEVRILDAFAYNFHNREIASVIKEYKPDVIGIAIVIYVAVNALLEISSLAKRINPKIITVAGGILPTYMYRELITHYPSLDFVIRGEGEFVFVQLLEVLERKEGLSNISGLAYRNRDNNTIVVNNGIGISSNFEVAPTLLNNIFIKKSRGVSYLDKASFVDIEASRGCKYKCNFCVVKGYLGTNVRYKNPQAVVNEIRQYHDYFGIRIFRFVDHTFTENREFVVNIVDEMMRRGLHRTISWFMATRLDCVDKELLKLLKKANCSRIGFGVETHSQDNLDYYHKGTTVEQSIEGFRLARENGISTRALLFLNQYMYSNQRELEQELKKIMRFLDVIKPERLAFVPLLIYPHTPLYEEYLRQKLINEYGNGKGALLKGRLIPSNYLSEESIFRAIMRVHIYFAVRRRINSVLKNLSMFRQE